MKKELLSWCAQTFGLAGGEFTGKNPSLRRFCLGTRAALLLCIFGGGSLAMGAPATGPNPSSAAANPLPLDNLRLNDYLQEVVRYNESLKAQMFETEVNRRKERAEYGAFEPQLELSATREGNRRTNNVEEQASSGGQQLFDEVNSLYEAGVETMLPAGGKVRLGTSISDLYNNVNPAASLITTTNAFFTRQYETFVGVNVTQPLLKNAGLAVSLAPLRLAALDSDIAFQQYRRQLMLTVSRAESAYWNLYYAQEQLVFFNESVAVAQGVLDDSRQKLQAGQGSELDVMEAQSGVAQRQNKRNEAIQDYYEAAGNLLSLTGQWPQVPAGTDHSELPAMHVADRPDETNADLTYSAGIQDAMHSNPDYLVLIKKVDQEALRLGVARNQLLPELDLKGAYGYNGIGLNDAQSWASLETRNEPSWSMGVELTVPLFGNIKDRNLRRAAQMALAQAQSTLRGTQTEIATHLIAVIQKTQSWQQSIQSCQTVIHFNEEMLKTQTERLKAGTIDAHKILEVEAELLDSRQELANALVQYRRSVLDEDLTTGDLLNRYGLETTREELRRRADALGRE
jgi:outer membrane protein TolC